MGSKSNTRLWHVGYRCEIQRPSGSRAKYDYFVVPVVMVSDNPRLIGYTRLKVRAITARAAARRYIRNNLAFDMASADYETNNPFGGDYMTMRPEFLKQMEPDVKRARIEVLR